MDLRDLRAQQVSPWPVAPWVAAHSQAPWQKSAFQARFGYTLEGSTLNKKGGPGTTCYRPCKRGLTQGSILVCGRTDRHAGFARWQHEANEAERPEALETML